MPGWKLGGGRVFSGLPFRTPSSPSTSCSPKGGRWGTNGRLRLRKRAGGGGCLQRERTLLPGSALGPMAGGAQGSGVGVPAPSQGRLRPSSREGGKAGTSPCPPRGRSGRKAGSLQEPSLEPRLHLGRVWMEDAGPGGAGPPPTPWPPGAAAGQPRHLHPRRLRGRLAPCGSRRLRPALQVQRVRSQGPHPCLQPDAARYLPALPRSVRRAQPELPWEGCGA